MGLLNQEIQELRQLLRRYQEKAIDEEEVRASISIYSQIEKRAKLMLNAYVVQNQLAKMGLKNEVAETNLIDFKERIDTETVRPEDETIKCPVKGDQKITRGDCLDFSGEDDHLGSCETCRHFRSTRRMI